MKNKNNHLKKVYLLPGRFFWGDKTHEVSTALGSCIAVCIWHPVKRIGGMCHYRYPGQRTKKRTIFNFHYGDDVLFRFLELIKQNKTVPDDYIVKIFGGSSMFEQHPNNTLQPIGASNSEFALNRLINYGFSIRIKEVGGNISRKIYFDLSNGEVWMQKLQKSSQ